MKSKRLFQVFVLFILLFSPFGNGLSVGASTSSAGMLGKSVQRNSPAFQDVTPAPPVMYIDVDPSSVNVGETTIVTVNLNNVPAEGYTSAEFTCSYDPSLLEVVDIFVTDLFGVDPVAVVNVPQEGRFIVALAGSHGDKATTDGTVVVFESRGLQAGISSLECQARVSSGSNTLTGITSLSNSVMILGPTVTPTIKPDPCNKVEFVADVDVPPGTVMTPGKQFRKTWRLKNVGSCTWTTSYRLAFFSGEQIGAPSSLQFPVNVPPGAVVDVSIDMTAPSAPGSYRGYWIFQSADGASFGIGPQGNQPWFVDIVVSGTIFTPTITQSPAPYTDTPTATSTFAGPTGLPTSSITPSGPTATPITGIAYDFAANACTAMWFSGAGQLPCPGIDGDPKGFVLRQDHPRLENGVTDARPGLLTFPQNIQNGYIQGFYPPFQVQNGDRFRATIGCENDATTCYVAFRLDYQVGSDPIRTFWGPFLERYEGRPFSTDVDLSRLAGQEVKFILTVLSAGVAQGDRALWASPIIYRANMTPTLTADVSSTSTATATPSPTPTTTPSSSFSPTPTFTSTATTTATIPPEGYGKVIGQAYASKPITVRWFDANSILSLAVDTGDNGVFSGYLVPGTYTMLVSADGFLSAQSIVTVFAGQTITLPGINLLAGDIDGNDVIDQFDAMTIGMNYNQAVPSVADLNGDAIINVLDLELLAKNYRKTGPVAW